MRRQLLLGFVIACLILSASDRASAVPPDPCARLFGALASPPKRVELAEAELKKAEAERACIMSIPWPKSVDRDKDDLWDMKSDVLKGLRTDIDRLEADFQKTYKNLTLRAIAGLYKNNTLTQQEVQFFVTRHGGLKLDQLKLYVDTLYVKALHKEKKNEEAVTVVADWRKRTDWKVEPRGFDKAEEHSFLNEQTLRNLMAGFDYAARFETGGKAPAEQLKLITDFLDDRPALDAIVRLQIGPGNLTNMCLRLLRQIPLEFDPTSPGVAADLAKYPSVAGVSKKDGTLTLYMSGNRLHALKRNRFGWAIISPREAAEDFQTYCREVVKDRSTGNMRLFNVMKYEDGFGVDFPDGPVRVTMAEAERLGRGESLPEDHALSKAIRKAGDSSLVLYANPLMLKPGRWLAEGDTFAFTIRRAYPEQRVYRDPLTEKTDDRARELTARFLTGTDDVVAVVADKSFKRVEDGKVIANLAGEGGEFDKAGIRVIKFNGDPADPTWTSGKGKAVIVITGHSNEELAGYVRALGKAGYLDGNYVVFNSCETPLTRELSFEITWEYKAAAVFCYEGKILAKDVKKTLGTFAAGIKAAVDAGKKVNLPDFLWKVIRDSALNGVWQISRAEFGLEEDRHG